LNIVCTDEEELEKKVFKRVAVQLVFGIFCLVAVLSFPLPVMADIGKLDCVYEIDEAPNN
jgi:hypothetical protein